MTELNQIDLRALAAGSKRTWDAFVVAATPLINAVVRRAPTRSPAERVLAWLYTGPLGHFWGAAADISEMWLRWMWSRARMRLLKR